MRIYHEDVLFALSILKRIWQEKELMLQIDFNNTEKSILYYLNDRLKKYMSECSLTGLSELNLMINLLIKLLDSRDFNDKEESFKTISALMFRTIEKTTETLNKELKSNHETLDFSVLEADELNLINIIHYKTESVFKQTEIHSDSSFDHTLKNQIDFDTEIFYPLFENALNIFTEQRDKDSFYIIRNHFDQFKGNIDLSVASLDSDFSENHPLIQSFRLCEKMEQLFDNNKMTESFDQSLIITIQTAFSLLHELMQMIQTNDSPGIIVNDIILQINDLLNIKPGIGKIENNKSIPSTIEVKTEVSEQKTENEKFHQTIVLKEKTELIKAQDDGYIRIKQEDLENITNMITELIVSNSSISYIQNKIRAGDSLLSIMQALQNTEKSFQRVISDLDKVVMTLRMQKMKELFQRFPRLVRDLAKNQGKKINFEISGDDLEMDNILMKQLADPLMHIIRNSCDHGIEYPEKRIEKGKADTGTIRLSAEINGSKMLISIYDDGEGLSKDRISKKAIEKGILTPADAQLLTDQQIYNLIFLPGFSTAEKVTEISGRGVGMDVVLQNISKVKGDIHIESVDDCYTKINISLPMTVSISKGLLISLKREQYFIPLENVVSIVQLKPKELHCFQEGFFIKYQEQLIGLRYLSDILNDIKSNDLKQKETILVVVLEINTTKRALMIDKVIGIQEISIRMLPDNLKHLDIYRGCATMSDGRAVLVLNPKKLFKET